MPLSPGHEAYVAPSGCFVTCVQFRGDVFAVLHSSSSLFVVGICFVRISLGSLLKLKSKCSCVLRAFWWATDLHILVVVWFTQSEAALYAVSLLRTPVQAHSSHSWHRKKDSKSDFAISGHVHTHVQAQHDATFTHTHTHHTHIPTHAYNTTHTVTGMGKKKAPAPNSAQGLDVASIRRMQAEAAADPTYANHLVCLRLGCLCV